MVLESFALSLVCELCSKHFSIRHFVVMVSGLLSIVPVIKASQDVILFSPSSFSPRLRKQTVFNSIKFSYILHTIQVTTCHSCGISINFQEPKRNSGEQLQTLKKKIMKTFSIERMHSQDKSAQYRLDFLYSKNQSKIINHTTERIYSMCLNSILSKLNLIKNNSYF